MENEVGCFTKVELHNARAIIFYVGVIIICCIFGAIVIGAVML